MKKLISAILIFFSLAIFSNISIAETKLDADNKTAQNTIEDFYTALKNKQIDKAASFFAPQFVGMHTHNNSLNRAQEVKILENLNMKNYKLTNFSFSPSGDVMVVTYKNAIFGTIEGKAISPKPSGRMMVLQKQNGQWLILTFASLAPLMGE